MSSGRPDFHPTMLLEGKHGTSLVPVLVDANGQMYIVMSGQQIEVTDILNVTDKDRDIWGFDGTTARPVAVDSAGIILARLKGLFGTTLKDVAVDTDGKIIALLQGYYGSIPKGVALDANGLIQVNLTVQDLSYLKVRPTYGQGILSPYVWTNVPTHTDTVLTTITGRGAILGGSLFYQNVFAPDIQMWSLFIDGSLYAFNTPETLYFDGIINNLDYPLSVSHYDPVTNIFRVRIGCNIPFEVSFVIETHQDTGTPQNAGVDLQYALVP